MQSMKPVQICRQDKIVAEALRRFFMRMACIRYARSAAATRLAITAQAAQRVQYAAIMRSWYTAEQAGKKQT